MGNRFVTIGIFTYLHEAEMAKSLLDASGIPAVIIDGFTIGMRPSYSSIFGGIKLQVPESCIEEARRIFSESAQPEDTQPEPPKSYSKLVWIKPVLAAMFAVFVYMLFQ